MTDIDIKRLAGDRAYWDKHAPDDTATEVTRDVTGANRVWYRNINLEGEGGYEFFGRFGGDLGWYKNKGTPVGKDRIKRPEPALVPGLPPVGATHETHPGTVIRHLSPTPEQWEVLAHRGDEAVVYCPAYAGGEQSEVYLLGTENFETQDPRRKPLTAMIRARLRGRGGVSVTALAEKIADDVLNHIDKGDLIAQ